MFCSVGECFSHGKGINVSSGTQFPRIQQELVLTGLPLEEKLIMLHARVMASKTEK